MHERRHFAKRLNDLGVHTGLRGEHRDNDKRHQSDLTDVDTEQARGRLVVDGAVPDRERPVVADARSAPLIDPLARVAPEVDATRGVADRKQRSGHDGALRRDEGQAAITVLPQPEQRDGTLLHVELDAHSPAALAVEDAEPAQARLVHDFDARQVVVDLALSGDRVARG